MVTDQREYFEILVTPPGVLHRIILEFQSRSLPAAKRTSSARSECQPFLIWMSTGCAIQNLISNEVERSRDSIRQLARNRQYLELCDEVTVSCSFRCFCTRDHPRTGELEGMPQFLQG
jgi:hypothetical protein